MKITPIRAALICGLLAFYVYGGMLAVEITDRYTQQRCDERHGAVVHKKYWFDWCYVEPTEEYEDPQNEDK